MTENQRITRLILHFDTGPEEIPFTSATLTKTTELRDLGSFSGPAAGEGGSWWSVTAEGAPGVPFVSHLVVEMFTVVGEHLRGPASLISPAPNLELAGAGDLEEL